MSERILVISAPPNLGGRTGTRVSDFGQGLEALQKHAFVGEDLVSHDNAIGDTISCDRDRLQRQKCSAIPPLLVLSLDCDRPVFWKEVGV